MRQIVETINQNDIKLNCITLDFCNELAEDDDDEEEEHAAADAQQAESSGLAQDPSAQINSGRRSEETENQQKNKDFLLKLQE